MGERFHLAASAHLMLRAARRLGVPEEGILRAAGVNRHELPPGGMRIRWPTLRALTQSALELTRQPALGLLAGLEVSIDDLGVPGSYEMHFRLLRESQAVAYTQIFPASTNLLRMWHEETETLGKMCVELIPPGDPLFAPHLHLFLGMHIRGLRNIFGPEVPILQLSLRAANLGDPTQLSAWMGCPVRLGEPEDCLVVPRSLLDRPMPQADAWVREQIRPQFEAFMREMAEDRITTLSVRMALEHQLTAGRAPDLVSVAGELRQNPRTLQARLKGEGSTFRALLDAARKEATLRHLTVPGVKISAVAASVGFSDAAAFTRAFSRWTGITPQLWREQKDRSRGGGAHQPRIDG